MFNSILSAIDRAIMKNTLPSQQTIDVTIASAAQGDAEAMHTLAEWHQNGFALTKDYAKAIELYTSAAEKGHVDSQYALGCIYYTGEITEKNLVFSYAWLNVAATNKHIWADDLRDDFETLMSVSQITEAQDLSKQILAGKSQVRGSKIKRNAKK